MLQKIFEVEILTVHNQRIVVHIPANDIHEIVSKLQGNLLTFVPRQKENNHTFTLFAHTLSKITYKPLMDLALSGKKLLYYDVVSG